MKELDLYKFIQDHNVEWSWEVNFDDSKEGSEDVLIFPHIFQIESFYKILSPSMLFDDDGITCVMKDGYFAIWMDDICECCGIEIEAVFPKEKK